MVARIVFVCGALVFGTALFFNRSRHRTVSDSEFVEATTVVTNENCVDAVLASEKPVVVDFYGDHCVVCRQPESKLLTLAKAYSEDAVFARVSVQDAPELSRRYKVKAVPTLVVIHRDELLFHGAGLATIPSVQTVLEMANRGKLP